MQRTGLPRRPSRRRRPGACRARWPLRWRGARARRDAWCDAAAARRLTERRPQTLARFHRTRFRGFFRSSCAALDKDKHEMYFLRHANGGASLAAVVRPDAPRQPRLSPHSLRLRPQRRALTSTAPAISATLRSRAWPPRRCTTARAAVRFAARCLASKPASRSLRDVSQRIWWPGWHRWAPKPTWAAMTAPQVRLHRRCLFLAWPRLRWPRLPRLRLRRWPRRWRRRPAAGCRGARKTRCRPAAACGPST